MLQTPLVNFNPEPNLIQETDPGVAETSGGNWATPIKDQWKQIPYQNGCLPYQREQALPDQV